MKKIIPLLLFFSSFSIWSQTNSGGGTTQNGGGGTGFNVCISSETNSDFIDILPALVNANVIGYKLYNSNQALTKEAVIPPTNNQIIRVSDITNDLYYIHLVLDTGDGSTIVINKQFYKQ